MKRIFCDECGNELTTDAEKNKDFDDGCLGVKVEINLRGKPGADLCATCIIDRIQSQVQFEKELTGDEVDQSESQIRFQRDVISYMAVKIVRYRHRIHYLAKKLGDTIRELKGQKKACRILLHSYEVQLARNAKLAGEVTCLKQLLATRPRTGEEKLVMKALNPYPGIQIERIKLNLADVRVSYEMEG